MTTWLITLAVILVILVLINTDTLPAMFQQRTCAGRAWKRAFPSATTEEIRTFLSVFVAAFAFYEKHKLKFRPDDQLLDIYRKLYPHAWQADALELETLAAELLATYHVSLHECWHDGLTLGELFAKLPKASNQ